MADDRVLRAVGTEKGWLLQIVVRRAVVVGRWSLKKRVVMGREGFTIVAESALQIGGKCR